MSIGRTTVGIRLEAGTCARARTGAEHENPSHLGGMPAVKAGMFESTEELVDLEATMPPAGARQEYSSAPWFLLHAGLDMPTGVADNAS